LLIYYLIKSKSTPGRITWDKKPRNKKPKNQGKPKDKPRETKGKGNQKTKKPRDLAASLGINTFWGIFGKALVFDKVY
jgi:hypothetical protein